jgi:transcriptional regulator with XRE-family HTH domain
MPSAESFHYRRPGPTAKQKEEFRRLVQRLKELSFERRYTRKDLAAELGISIATVNLWWIGYTLSARPHHLERLERFLSDALEGSYHNSLNRCRLP